MSARFSIKKAGNINNRFFIYTQNANSCEKQPYFAQLTDATTHFSKRISNLIGSKLWHFVSYLTFGANRIVSPFRIMESLRTLFTAYAHRAALFWPGVAIRFTFNYRIILAPGHVCPGVFITNYSKPYRDENKKFRGNTACCTTNCKCGKHKPKPFVPHGTEYGLQRIYRCDHQGDRR